MRDGTSDPHFMRPAASDTQLLNPSPHHRQPLFCVSHASSLLLALPQNVHSVMTAANLVNLIAFSVSIGYSFDVR